MSGISWNDIDRLSEEGVGESPSGVPISWADIDEAAGRTKTPFGRELKEAQRKSPWGRELSPRLPDYGDFREIGLSESDAKEAVKGLNKGAFLSFEDAALSVSIKHGSIKQLQETLMRSKGARFARPVREDR